MKKYNPPYYAFISYSGSDEKWAKWLHKKLEYYHIPTDLCKEHSNLPKRIRPVFWYRQDLSGTKLKKALHSELNESRFLIVVCSPKSAQAYWVNDEVQAFINQGKGNKIIPFIVSGTPHSPIPKEECFPKSLRNLSKEEEIRGIDVRRTEGKMHALVDVIATMFGIRLDELWKRHKRERKKKILTLSFLFCFVCFFVYWLATPIKLSVKLTDEKHSLPLPKDAILTVNGTTYFLNSLDTTICINRFPGYLRLHKVDVNFQSTYYKQINEKVALGCGINNIKNINLKRDSTFAIFSGKVICKEWEPVEKAKITIEKHITFTDKNGFFKIAIPIHEQTVCKKVLVEKQDFRPIVKLSEYPSSNIGYLLKEK